MAVHVMTDKKETKELPCTYPECRDTCIVNKFFAPAKVRCPQHSGVTTSTMRALVADPEKAGAPAHTGPVRSLQDIRCPFDDEALYIIRINDGAGTVDFGCRECQAVVSITPAWAALLIKSTPERWKEFIEGFNNRQHAVRHQNGGVFVETYEVREGPRWVVIPANRRKGDAVIEFEPEAPIEMDPGSLPVGSRVLIYEPAAEESE